MRITKTKHGLRLSQHGVVISELRTSAGPTHSVFDLLAALIVELAPPSPSPARSAPRARVGVMGFAGGGMMAPLRGLDYDGIIESCDLDRPSYQLFRRHCSPSWVRQVRWHQRDAVAWLKDQPGKFDLLIDDLSVPQDGDVVKPAVSWDTLPGLMRRRIARGGRVVFNLLPLPGSRWRGEPRRVIKPFSLARGIVLDDFENQIVVAGSRLPSAGALALKLRQSLRRLGSNQAERIRVRTL